MTHLFSRSTAALIAVLFIATSSSRAQSPSPKPAGSPAFRMPAAEISAVPVASSTPTPVKKPSPAPGTTSVTVPAPVTAQIKNGLWIPDPDPSAPPLNSTSIRPRGKALAFVAPNFPVLRAAPPTSVPQGGICAVLGAIGPDILFTTVVPEGTAAKTGIAAGDFLTQVNGQPVHTAQEAAALIWGDAGSKINLTILPVGQTTPKTVEVVREDTSKGNFPKAGASWLLSQHGADAAALAKITLPANPTRDQVHDYIRDIYRASAGQNIVSPSDPQIAMLKKIGHENLDLLIDLTPLDGIGSIYGITCINKLADDKDASLLISKLATQPGLIRIIQQRGWVEQAKPAMLEILSKQNIAIDPEFFMALSSLRDPSLNQALVTCFKLAPDKYQNFNLLQKVPHIDLKAAVDQAWAYQKSLPPTGPFGDTDDYGLAVVAATYGNRDALDYLFKIIMGNKLNITPPLPDVVNTIFALTNADPGNIGAWYKKNGDKLRYDKTTQMFLIPEE